jgi:tetratricopeptide (TPR) repeat protein
MTQYANVAGQHNIIVQVVGDGNTIVPNHAHLTLTRYLTRRGRTKSEADLLSPYAMAIPMLGREVQIAEFRRWLTTSQPITIRVLVGQAGSGKTRLALELCEAMIADNWDAGFVTDRELVRFLQQQNLSAWGWQRPTLVVVDAAATRARLLHDWLVELADHVGDLERPLRLLFIERHADPTVGWWEWVFGRGGEDARAIQSLLDPPDRPIALPALVGTEARRAILLATLERVGSAVRPPVLGDDLHFDQQLAALTWGGEPLFLMMAGLTAAHVGIGHVLALARTDLAFRIAENEIDRIERIAAERRVPAAFLSHMAAYETLCQGLSRPVLEAVIDEEKAALRRPSAGDAPEIAEALYATLPGEEGRIIPVLPPMIGEAVVLRVLGRLTDEGQCAAVSRAAQHAREYVAATVVHLVQDYVQAGYSAPLAWLDDLIQKHATDHEALIEIMDQFPAKTVALRERAVTIMVLITQIMRELPIPLESGVNETVVNETARLLFTFAASLNNLGSRLGQLGCHKEALAALQEAVEIRRTLAAIDPKGFRPALADSLSNLSNCLSIMRYRKEALTAIQEAVGLYRELAAIDPEAIRPALAVVLSTGRHEKISKLA